MESKKKKKLITILLVVSVLVIASVISIVLVVKNSKDKSNSGTPATNVSMTTDEIKRNEAEKAIIRKEVPENYNGSYTFSHVGTIFYNEKLSNEQIRAMLESQGAKNGDENTFKDILNSSKSAQVNANGEIIVLSHGRYTCSYSKTKKIIETGVYYGNDDLCDILIRNTSTNKHEQKYKMSLTYQTDTLGANSGASNLETDNQIVIFRNIVSDNDPNLVLMTISYVYNRIKDTTDIIQNDDLIFNI